MTTVDYDWRRYALIQELSSEMKTRGHTFGKTALQKLVYFLEEFTDVETGYEFSLYTYGPFSSALLGDLDNAKELGAVEVVYNGFTNGYDIRPGANTSIREKARQYIEGHAATIKKIVKEFGGMYAKDLELRATLVYAERDARARGTSISKKELVDTVHGLKPHFSEETIEHARQEMEEKGYIKTSRPKLAKA
jgi:uncharacterized protein YwgA